MMKKALVWFRQDLRLRDNTALNRATQEWYQIIPIFIFDQFIVEREPKNDPRFGFLIQALQELDNQLIDLWNSMRVYYGDPTQIISELVDKYLIDAVFANRSYGTGVTRDSLVWESLKIFEKELILCEDYLLVEPHIVEQRKVFTPFYKLWQKVEKKEVWVTPNKILDVVEVIWLKWNQIIELVQPWENKYWPIDWWKARFENFDFWGYDDTRNFPAIDGSTKLSPYLRFGLVSVREIYRHCETHSSIGSQVVISELARRDYRHHVIHYFPFTIDIEFQEKRRWIKWSHQQELFEAWCEGRTWYPIVDAGMRQLKQEWWMHNRVRMIVASFLTKDLMIDRRLWEQHFARYLIDYDRNVNVWNRQWSASVGADPKPIRIFSPILQSERFDPECTYIKKYIPELVNHPAKLIHNPLENKLPYISPIVDHRLQQKLAKDMYRSAGGLEE